MEIEFDPVKDATNIANHGLTLADAGMLDLPTAMTMLDSRDDYGELATVPSVGLTVWVTASSSPWGHNVAPDQFPPCP